MGGRETGATRIQVYLTDPRVVAALKREARSSDIPISQAAARALAKGLARSLPADPDDRLLQLDRALRDHMRSTTRDVQIIQELVVEVARAFFMRLPDAVTDQDPVARAAVEEDPCGGGARPHDLFFRDICIFDDRPCRPQTPNLPLPAV